MSSAIVIGALVVVSLGVLASRGQSPPQPPTSPEQRARLEEQFSLCLAAGHKIEAIKLYRCLHGMDLKSSKAAVESLLVGGSFRQSQG